MDACISTTMSRISVAGLRFQVEDTDCDTLAKEEWVSVYGSAGTGRGRTLLFKYSPASYHLPLPTIEAPDQRTIIIAIPIVSSVYVKLESWNNHSRRPAWRAPCHRRCSPRASVSTKNAEGHRVTRNKAHRRRAPPAVPRCVHPPCCSVVLPLLRGNDKAGHAARTRRTDAQAAPDPAFHAAVPCTIQTGATHSAGSAAPPG